MKSIEQLFDNYASQYQKKFDENPLGYYQRCQIHDFISPYLQNTKSILDVGCGPGSDFEFYKKMNLSVDAIDVSGKMVELAQEKATDLKLSGNISKSSLEEFKTSTKYPVIILNFGVINSIQNLGDALKKLKNLLKPQGILVIVSMPPFHFFSLKGLAVGLHFFSIMNRLFKRRIVLKDGFTIHYYSKKDFVQYFEIISKINLCAFLPNPDQYYCWKWLRLYTKIIIHFDRKIGAILPDVFGGDHICYVMK